MDSHKMGQVAGLSPPGLCLGRRDENRVCLGASWVWIYFAPVTSFTAEPTAGLHRSGGASWWRDTWQRGGDGLEQLEEEGALRTAPASSCITPIHLFKVSF